MRIYSNVRHELVVQYWGARTKVRKAAKRPSFQLSTTEVLTDRPP